MGACASHKVYVSKCQKCRHCTLDGFTWLCGRESVRELFVRDARAYSGGCGPNAIMFEAKEFQDE